MSDLYDFDASLRRVARAEQAVTTQQIYIAKQTDPEFRARAEANLVSLNQSLEIARKTHLLIMEVIAQREEDDFAPNFEDGGSKPRAY